MHPSPRSGFNTLPIHLSNDAPKATEQDSRKFDPAKATIYVALVTLVGTLGVPIITKAFANDSGSDNAVVVGQAMTLQKYKYEQLMAELDEDLREIDAENEALNQENLPAKEKTKKYLALREVLANVIAVKTSLPEQFATYQRQFKAGDHVGALKTQSDINRSIFKKRAVKLKHQPILPRLKDVWLTPVMAS